MSLSQKSRTAIYEALSGMGTDPDAVEELLSHFPSRDLDEPVTKEFHRAESATLRAEMADSAAQLRTEMAELRTELRSEMAELRTELRSEMAQLRAETHVGFAEIRTEMHQGFQRMTLSLAALMVSMTGAMVAAVTIAR